MTTKKPEISYIKITLILVVLIFSTFSVVHSQNQGSNYIVATEGVEMTGAQACYNAPPTPTLDWSYQMGDFPGSEAYPASYGDAGEHELVGAGKIQDAFRVQVDSDSNFASPEYNPGATWTTNTTDTSVQVSGLNYATTYYWRVETRDVLGWDWTNSIMDRQGLSGWVTSTRAFITPPACP